MIGGAFNETMPPLDGPPSFRQDDLFLSAAFSFLAPLFTLLHTQETEGLAALCTQFPAFQDAYAQGKVGHHFMVARSDALPGRFDIVPGRAPRGV